MSTEAGLGLAFMLIIALLLMQISLLRRVRIIEKRAIDRDDR